MITILELFTDNSQINVYNVHFKMDNAICNNTSKIWLFLNEDVDLMSWTLVITKPPVKSNMCLILLCFSIVSSIQRVETISDDPCGIKFCTSQLYYPLVYYR